MFLDKVTITIKAGNGGNGHASFFRDNRTTTGGPDGGDGGHGGDIIFIGTTRESNLVNFRYTKKFMAEDGMKGGTTHKTGKRGAPMIIEVPLGTRIHKIGEANKINDERPRDKDMVFGQDTLLADITVAGQEYIALKGGAGGRGNARFATATKQTPNFSQTGVVTKPYHVRLELNTIADIGLVGFPNVGKSSLLSVISRANPKIANYHFTTLHPNVGITNIFDQNMIVADIPGLIEGASDGAGLGHDFLRHIVRTRLLIHVIDIAQVEERNAIEDFDIINKELAGFSKDLANRPMIVALNKIDVADEKIIAAFKKKFGEKTTAKGKTTGYKIFEISTVTRDGVQELFKSAATILNTIPKPEIETSIITLEERVDKNAFTVRKESSGKNGVEFFVEGGLIDNLIRGVVLDDTESNYYFQRRLIDTGIIDELKKQGMKEGDSIHIKDVEFEWVE